ncbi:hypothetical protein Cantr_06572 [Candida viswanathii]|uniref:RRM domain-containing protein n=1 Tax=Candida viswanathii TaxID=5486 RepID=A0A367XWD7_9ASCO|nr:hypothetical protein Cantr_06572 [Candida viswanathii]
MKTSSSSLSSISRSSNLELLSISLASSRISNEDLKKAEDELEEEQEEEQEKSGHQEEQEQEQQQEETDEDDAVVGEPPHKPKQELIDCLDQYILTNRGGNGQTYSNFPIIMRIPIDGAKQTKNGVEEVISQCLGISSIYHQDHNEVDDDHRGSRESYITIGFTTKNELDDLIYKLHEEQITYELDYSKFISHPGILFIKNLSSNLMFDDGYAMDSITIDEATNPKHKLFEFLMDNCHFKSLQEVKIFNNNNNNNNNDNHNSPSSNSLSSFAIVKFTNHLDVDILIKKFNKYVPNIFNNNNSVPLFLNKYLNRKERFVPPNLSLTSPQQLLSNHATSNNSKSNDNFNLIIVENLLNFFPQWNFCRVDFEVFIDKFKNFGNVIEMIYFPLVDKGVNLEDIKTYDYGFIKFKQPNTNLMENTLRILYYLNDLSWEEFSELDVENLPGLLPKDVQVEEEDAEIEEKQECDDLQNHINQESNDDDEEGPDQGRISITIAQHKHNHNLFAQANNFYLSLTKNSSIGVSFPNPMFTINQFSRSLNYQETNIYVNNLPIVFNNDDVTWEAFWSQFGIIKSAKIIKPQFYHEDEDEHKSGKIGFVFYKSFKMAIRAILMTNNKVVNVEHFNPIVIQSSFAIQKSNSNKDFKQQQQQLQQQLQMQMQQQQQHAHLPHHHAHHPHHQQPLHHLPLQPHHIQQSLAILNPHHHHHHHHHHNPSHINSGQGGGGGATGGGVAIAAAAAAAAANNQPYFAYQPMIPYYYGYHPNPFQFANGIPTPAAATGGAPTGPPPHPNSGGAGMRNSTGNTSSTGAASSGPVGGGGTGGLSVSSDSLSGNGGNPNNMSAYSNYLIPARAYPYYYFEGQSSSGNGSSTTSTHHSNNNNGNSTEKSNKE